MDNTTISSLEVIFDNGGGIYLQTAAFSHHYDDGNECAHDTRAILAGTDPMDWDGNNNHERLEYSALERESRNLYTHYTQYELQCEIDSKDELKTSGRAETDFLRTLTGRRHIDDHNEDCVCRECLTKRSKSRSTLMPMMKCGHAANATDSLGNPACAICVGLTPNANIIAGSPDLTGRLAKCSCGRTTPSDLKTCALFEYCGPGSTQAAESCKCGYNFVAHSSEYMARNVPSNRRTVVEQGKCTGFVARGPLEFDRYYCGHAGWD